MTANPPSNLRSFEDYHPEIGERVLLDPSAVIVGQVSIGDDCSIWPHVTVRGDVHAIEIGARTSIQDGSVLHVTHAGPRTGDGHALRIGSDVTVGHRVTLHGCTIGDRVLVGMGSTVMDAAVIEDDVVIGAGSLVAPGKRLRSGYLYLGSPAREVRPLSEDEREGLDYSAAHYVRLKDRHLRDG